MSTDAAVIDPPNNDVGPTMVDDISGALDRWEEANKKQEPAASEPNVEVPKEEPPKDEIPGDLLRESEPVVDPDEELLTKKPTGPIKHEHFEKVQALSAKKIAAMQAERDAAIARIKEFEGKTGQPDDKTKAQLEALQKERDEYLAEIDRLAFERSPKFKQRFTARENAVQEAAKKAFVAAGGDASLLPEIMAASETRRFQLLDALEKADGTEISQSAKQYLITKLSELDTIQAEKNEALAQSRESLTAWEREEASKKEANQAARQKGLESLMERIITKASTEFEPLRKVNGNEKWNADVDERINKIKRIAIGESSDEEILQAVTDGVGAKVLHGMVGTLKAENKTLREKIATLESAQPGTANGRAVASANGKDETPEDRWERNQQAAMGMR